MATYAEVIEAFEKRRAAPKSSAPPEGPGLLGALTRGAIQSPGNIMDMAEFSGLNFKRPVDPSTGETISMGESTRRGVLRRADIPEPVTGRERIMEAIGERAPFIAAGGVGGFAAGGVGGLALEVGREVAAAAAGAQAKEWGLGTFGQLGAEILASVIIPGPIVAPGKVAKVVRPSRDQAIAKIAKKYGLSKRQARAAIDTTESRIMKDPTTGLPDKPRAIQKLDEAIEQFPDPRRSITTEQALGEDAGENIAALTKKLSRESTDVSGRIFAQRRAVKEDILSEVERLTPRGVAARTPESAKKAIERLEREAAEAWDAVPMEQMPQMSLRGAKKAIAQLEKSPADRRWLPPDAQVIKSYDDTVPMSEFQKLRRDLLTAQRKGFGPTATEEAQKRAERVNDVLDAMQKEIDGLPQEGGDLYLRARTLTKRNKRLLDPKEDATKALTQFEEPERIVRKIKGSRNPVRAIRRAKKMLEGQPEAMDDLRAAFFEDIAGEFLEELKPSKALDAIRRKGDVYREILGGDEVRDLQLVLKKLDKAMRTQAGTAAAAATTGSNIGDAVGLALSFGEAAASPVQSSVGMLGRWIGRNIRGRLEENALARELVISPRVTKELLEVPDPENLSRWLWMWNKTVEKAKAYAQSRVGRQGASSAAAVLGQSQGSSIEALPPAGAR